MWLKMALLVLLLTVAALAVTETGNTSGLSFELSLTLSANLCDVFVVFAIKSVFCNAPLLCY